MAKHPQCYLALLPRSLSVCRLLTLSRYSSTPISFPTLVSYSSDFLLREEKEWWEQTVVASSFFFFYFSPSYTYGGDGAGARPAADRETGNPLTWEKCSSLCLLLGQGACPSEEAVATLVTHLQVSWARVRV